MNILAVIPARYDSKRFPGKPLAMIGDRPMVQWVHAAAKSCSAFNQVVVATDSQAVANCVREFGGKVEMTSSKHFCGTDRVAEVAVNSPEADVVVNVQGDQPFVTPEMLNRLLTPYLQGETPDSTTLACPLDPEKGYTDSNTVKVICDLYNRALYFSRSPIPFYRSQHPAPVYHHLGLYAFRRDIIVKYSTLKPTPLELCEHLDQLRILEHGHSMYVCQNPEFVSEVNTPEDLRHAQSLVDRGLVCFPGS